VGEVKNRLMRIDSNKAAGPDGIPNWILHDCSTAELVDKCMPKRRVLSRVLEIGRSHSGPKGQPSAFIPRQPPPHFSDPYFGKNHGVNNQMVDAGGTAAII